MIIGVLSDTHLTGRRELPDEVFAAFDGVELILHAGDLNTLELLDVLRAIAPVQAVAGNTDPWDVAQALGERKTVEAGGLTIGLVHGHVGKGRTTPERARSWFPAAEVVVFGHSHQPLIERVGEQLLVNPGSPTDRRRSPHHSCAILTVIDGVAAARLVEW